MVGSPTENTFSGDRWLHPCVMCLFIFNCSTVALVREVAFSWAGTSSFNLCMSLYIVFLLQFSKNFMGHYWVTKMGADFASLCQKIFITAIILREIMFQQVQAVCKMWHMCELAISHRSYNIVSNNKTKGRQWGGDELQIHLVMKLLDVVFIRPREAKCGFLSNLGWRQ